MKSSLPDDRDPCCLTIDQGGHAVRACLFDAQGQQLAAAEEAIACDEHWEYDGARLLAAVRRVVGAAIGELPAGRPAPCCAALATQRSNTACWDRATGQALSPVISWQDRRGAQWLEGFTAHADTIRRITGLPLSPHYGAAKFHWCLEHLPAAREALAAQRLAMGPMASYLVFHLLQERPLLSDPVNASRTLLWDIRHHDWSHTLLDLFAIPPGALPRCVPTRHAWGTLDSGGCHIPLMVVTGDQAAALYAHGEPDPDTIYITLGTGAFIQRPTGATPRFTPALLTSVLIQDGGTVHYTLEGTVNGAGSALAWLEEELDLKLDFAQLARWLAEDPADTLLFLNGVAGLGTPFMQAAYPSRFIGQGGVKARARAVVESIAFLVQLNLENIRSASGPAARILVGGGLARLDGLCQRIADLSALPVERMDDHETTSRGLACLLGCAPRAEPSHGQGFSPAPAPALSGRYRRWKQLMGEAA